MFAVYGISGPLFQGSLENLNRLQPVMPRPPVVLARRVGDQLDFGVRPDEQAAQALRPSAGQALEAYQAALPQSLERGPIYHAEQIMRRPVITVRADDDVARAWNVLIGNLIHEAPVLDVEGRLVGIVGERNLLTALNVDAGQLRDVLGKRVADVMTTPVVCAAPGTDVRRIARVMLERDVEGVPVVSDAGMLLGFISHSDILKAVVADPPLSVWR